MAKNKHKPGTPGAFSRWMQKRMNARMIRKVRGGKAKFMGMDVLVLNTVGSRTGQPRETPIARFGDGKDTWLSTASGGGSQNPDWYTNLMAHPEKATIELPGPAPVLVTRTASRVPSVRRPGSSSRPPSPASPSTRASPTGSTQSSSSPPVGPEHAPKTSARHPRTPGWRFTDRTSLTEGV